MRWVRGGITGALTPARMNALMAAPSMHPRGYGASSPMTEPNGFPPSFAAKLAELKRAFMQQLPARFAALEAALAQGDLTTLTALSHQLRGVAGSYGLSAVSHEAERLEEAARASLARSGTVDDDTRGRLQQLIDAARAAVESSPS